MEESGSRYLLPILAMPLLVYGWMLAGEGETTLATLGLLVPCLAAAWLLAAPRFASRFVTAASPQALGAIRIIICSILFAATLRESLPSSALLPREMLQPMGAMDLFHRLPIGFDRFIASETALRVWSWGTATALLLGALGWRTRVTVPLGAIGLFLIAGIQRQYFWFTHTGILPLYAVTILAFTPCGDGWSLDARRKARQGRPAPAPSLVYGWSRYACWLAISLWYLAAGLSKLRNGGVGFWHPLHLKTILLNENLDPMQFDFSLGLKLAAAPDALFTLLGVSTVVIETLFILVLFWGWARIVVPVSTALLHVGIWLLQNLLFFDLILIQAVFLNFDRLARALGRAPTEASQKARTPKSGLAARETVLFPQRALVLLVGCVLLSVWALRIEFYPLTAVQMYSKPRQAGENAGTLRYNRLLAHYEDGSISRFYPESTIGAVIDGRYRRVLQLAFRPERVHVLEEFLEACTARANRTARPGRKVMAYEIQHWYWDFLADPLDEQHGSMERRYVYTVKRTPTAAAGILQN